jgi:hypothetical protein
MNFTEFKAKNKNILVARYQTTAQIAGCIVRAIDESQETAEKIKHYFENSNPIQSAKLIFYFCKNTLPYTKESGEEQTVKTLTRMLQDCKKTNQKFDCKHYSILTASLLKSLGIKCKLRLISQKPYTKQPNHIYTIAIINGKEYIVDAVIKNFNDEARYNYKYDINLN